MRNSKLKLLLLTFRDLKVSVTLISISIVVNVFLEEVRVWVQERMC